MSESEKIDPEKIPYTPTLTVGTVEPGYYTIKDGKVTVHSGQLVMTKFVSEEPKLTTAINELQGTPRTDAEFGCIERDYKPYMSVEFHGALNMLANFARQLERELNQETAELSDTKHELSQCDDIALNQPLANAICDMQRDRQRLYAEVEALKQASYNNLLGFNELLTENEQLKQEVERLKKLLEASAWNP